MIIAAIEAGGTKFVWGLLKAEARDRECPKILERGSIPTTSPKATLDAVATAISEAAKRVGSPEALGIGSFGPVVLKRSDPDWGKISVTPKPGWSWVDIAGYFRLALDLPIAFDTDVNAAAYGEYLWGEARGIQDFIYLTVGTGIGGGVFSGGSLVHGLSHPELGHIKMAREPDDAFAGSCPYHRDCLEGMASGAAMARRWGCRAEELPPGHRAWELEATYLARAVATYSLVLSPELVLIGGGVGLRPGLVERVDTLVGEELAGYIPALTVPGCLESFVKRPKLGSEAGLIGSAGLAIRLVAE